MLPFWSRGGYSVGMATPEDELYELLKQGSDAGTQMPNNEDQSVSGTTNLYEDPQDRVPAGYGGSPWGEDGPKGVYHSDGVRAESIKDRQGVLGRAFGERALSNGGDEKRLMAKHLATAASGNFETHSLGMGGRTPEKTASLMERVRKLSGRV